MSEDSRNVSKNALYNTIGTFTYFFCQWVTTIVVIRLIGFEQGGIFSLIISYSNIFGFFALFGIRNYQVSDIKGNFTSGQYLSARIITISISTVLFCISTAIFSYSKYILLCCFVYLLFKFFETLTDYYFAVMQKHSRYDCIAISYCLKGILPLFLFISILYIKKNLLAAIVVMEFSYFAVIVVYDKRIEKKYENIYFDFSKVKRILIDCIPIMLFSLIVPYMTFITRYMIGNLYSNAVLGFYSSFAMITVVMSTLAGSVWNTYVPIISKLYQDDNKSNIIKIVLQSMIWIFIIGIFTLILGNLLGPYVFSLLFGYQILEYMYLLNPVIISSILLTAGSFLSIVLISLQRRSKMLLCNFIGALVCTAIVYTLTKNFGANGASFSLIIGFTIQIILLSFLFFKESKKIHS